MNPTVYAIAKADLLLRVADPICCEDGYDGKRFPCKCLQEHPTFIALSSDLAGEQLKCAVVAALQRLP
jgi:hypothetical protein